MIRLISFSFAFLIYTAVAALSQTSVSEQFARGSRPPAAVCPTGAEFDNHNKPRTRSTL